MKYIAVFCGSSAQSSEKYIQAAKELGRLIVERGYGLVFGGANVGLMKAVADGAKAAMPHVAITGVITPEVEELGLCYPGIDLRTVENYEARKKMMADLSVGFITLPGGFGSMDETFGRLIN